MRNNQDLMSLLLIVQKNFFNGHKPTMLGKFEWLAVSERQAERYFKKTGENLSNQYRRFKITQKFFTSNLSKSTKPESQRTQFIRFYHLLISNINYNDMTFYIVADNCVGPLVGETIRYQFKILESSNEQSIELVQEKIIAIR